MVAAHVSLDSLRLRERDAPYVLRERRGPRGGCGRGKHAREAAEVLCTAEGGGPEEVKAGCWELGTVDEAARVEGLRGRSRDSPTRMRSWSSRGNPVRYAVAVVGPWRGQQGRLHLWSC